MNASFFDTDPEEKKYLKHKLEKHVTLKFFSEPISENNVKDARDSEIISGFIYSKFPKETLANLPKLKLIATQSTGFDHIDLDYCKKNGITVSNVPSYGSHTVAEHTFALILAISRRIIEANKRVREGGFSPEGLTGFDLYGKTLGVVGTGKIGKNVIKIAKGFSMNVLAYDPFEDKDLERYLGIKYVSLENLLKSSDIVSLHCPSTKENRHMINEQTISIMKKGSVIINTARGELIDTNALYKALEDGHIKGAGLDTIEEEGFLKEERELLSKGEHRGANLEIVVKDHILIRRKDVIVTPHNAFNSKEALRRILDTTIENVISFLEGRAINKVG